jgi:hypothetical protein
MAMVRCVSVAARNGYTLAINHTTDHTVEMLANCLTSASVNVLVVEAESPTTTVRDGGDDDDDDDDDDEVSVADDEVDIDVER